MIRRSIITYINKKAHHAVFHYISTDSSSSMIPSSPLPPQDSLTLNRLNHKDWLAPNEVLKIIKALKDPSSVITLLDRYAKRKDYKPNEVLYTLVINKFVQANMFDAVEDVMQRIRAQEHSCQLSDEFFYNVIKIYGNVAGRISKAIDTLFDMPKYNCWPTVKTFNFVLNLLVSAKLFDVVHEVYMGSPKLGIEVDACCLNILIKGLCECGKLEAAFHVLDEFPKQKCKPNVRTFSTLMHAFCERGKVDEAFGLFERMEKEGIFPDTITFNILIAGLRKEGRVEEGKELLERMKHKGCYPNSGSYQEVFYGLLYSKKFVEAKEFTGGMISEGLSPSFVSYKLMVRGLCKKNLLGDVDWVLKQMVRQGFIPKRGMWKRILRSMFPGKNRCSSSISYEEIVGN
jgi:pentatricopeptide repeat protein